MVLFIVFLILGSALSLLTHETSHLVVAKIFGWEIAEFQPWPHKFKNRLMFGRTSVYVDPTDPKLPYMHCSPLWVSWAMFLVYLCAAGFVHWSFFALAFWEIVDYVWWWVGFLMKREGSDGKKMRDWLTSSNSGS